MQLTGPLDRLDAECERARDGPAVVGPCNWMDRFAVDGVRESMRGQVWGGGWR